MDIKYYKEIVEEMKKVNIRSKKFNVKWVKNLLALENFVNEYERDSKPPKAFLEYLEKLQNAKGNFNAVRAIKQANKKVIENYKKQQMLVAQKYSNYAIDLEEFTLDELPSNICSRAMRCLYKLDLIKEKTNANKN